MGGGGGGSATVATAGTVSFISINKTCSLHFGVKCEVAGESPCFRDASPARATICCDSAAASVPEAFSGKIH